MGGALTAAGPRTDSPTADEKEPRKTGTSFVDHVNVQPPRETETPGQRRSKRSGASVRRCPRLPSRAIVPSKEAHPLKAVLGSARVTAPILLKFGAAWTAQTKADYAALSTALCRRVCVVGLFGDDRVQRGYRQDLVVLAHVASYLGAEALGIPRAVGTPERVVNRNLGQPAEGGWWSWSTTAPTPHSRLTG